MRDIKTQKLLYHLTELGNLESILRDGLLPRSQIEEFVDVADHDILDDRKKYNLENYVPFHWFAGNPFDGRVQGDHPRKKFVLITVQRSMASRGNWKVIPRHPLAGGQLQILDYEEGFKIIDWDVMNTREYRDQVCKNICMAECLSPVIVPSKNFFRIYVRDQEIQRTVAKKIKNAGLNFEAEVNDRMFRR